MGKRSGKCLWMISLAVVSLVGIFLMTERVCADRALEKYIPTWCIEKTTQLTPEMLDEVGIDIIFTDLDNTLLPYEFKDIARDIFKQNYATRCSEVCEEVKSWVKNMKEHGKKIKIISNNFPSRTRIAAKTLGIDDWEALAVKPGDGKPNPTAINRSLAEYDISKERAVMVGDQIHSDVVAGYNAGIQTILVKPMVDYGNLVSKINHYKEDRIMKSLNAAGIYLIYQTEITEENRVQGLF